MGKKETEKTGKRRNRRLEQSFYAIALLPLVLFGLIMLLAGYPLIQNALHTEAQNNLEDTATLLQELIDTTWPGDYELRGEEALYLYKGGEDITFDTDLIDTVSNSTGLKISLIYKDTRIQTTIMDKLGVSVMGTGVAQQIVDTVLGKSKPMFYSNAMINGREFFAYYLPLFNSDGSTVGMLEVAKPASEVSDSVRKVLFPFLLIDLGMMLIAVFAVFRFSSGLSKTLDKLHDFLAVASDGETDVDMDPGVLERRDEISEIGDSVLKMHRSLRNVMERDALTQLYNRRSADRKIKSILARAKSDDDAFSLSIGDIDFFKKVNDTYGHDAGDEVLKAVAATLQDHMLERGIVARWGGEEFLLVFDRMNLEKAEKSLWELLGKIRALDIVYGEQHIPVTMTFGVSEWNGEMSVDDLLRDADGKLYYGKEGGRNRVVSELDPGTVVEIPAEEHHGSRVDARVKN